MKVIDYEMVCDIFCLLERKIFIYGTGKYGNRVANAFLQMKIEVDGFCETIPEKDIFLGKRVLSSKDLISNYDKNDVLVIIASERYFKEMIHELQVAENMDVCTYYALFLSLFLNYETVGTERTLKDNIKFFKKVSLEIAKKNFMKWGMDGYCYILSQPSLTLIYQPGKVGSKTIYHSSPLETYHLHSLAYVFNADGDTIDICNKMVDKLKREPIKIITGVREPILRDISLFFEGTENNIWPLIYYGNCTNYLFGNYREDGKLNIAELQERICVFEENLAYSFEHLGKEIMQSRADEFSWFDYEIKALLGVDIYEHPFDKEKGYTIIEQGNIKILLYKCEKLSQLESVIGCFIGKPGFLLNNANQGDEKVYSYVYRGFREKVKLQKEYFDYYYGDNPRLKHFYTDIEIERFKDRWKERLQEG